MNSFLSVVISDGVHSASAIFGAQCNPMIHQGFVSPGCIIRITEYISNEVKEKRFPPPFLYSRILKIIFHRIVIILGCEVVSQPIQQIGNPIDLDEGGDISAPPAPQRRAPPAAAQPPPFQRSAPPSQAPQYQGGQQQPPQYAVSPPQHDAEDISHNQLCPIKMLTPYRQRWTIKVRCTNKSSIRTWHNDKSAGSVANVTLLDEDGSEIQATLWKESIEKFYPILEVNNMYFISRALVKPSNKRFATVNSEYEIEIRLDTIIQPARDDNTIAAIHFQFTPLNDLRDLAADTLVDVIGVLTNIGEITEFTSKAGRPTSRRNVTLADYTGVAVELTLWGEKGNAIDFSSALHGVLAAKGVRVSDFNGKSLSSGFSTILQLNPALRETADLQAWYAQGSPSLVFLSQGKFSGGGGGEGRRFQYKTIAQMKEESVHSQDASFFNVKATIILFRKEGSNYYPGCPTCQKKLQVQNGQLFCEKCSSASEIANYRYIMSFNAADETGSQWLSSFDDVGQIVIGYTAGQLNEWKESQNEAACEAAFDEACFKSYKFR